MDFALALVNHSQTPLHLQLYHQLRSRILSGQLQPGQRLPSSRSLAQLLNISRATATLGYGQLLSEGYLEAKHGSGTFVCEQLPEALLQVESKSAEGTAVTPDPRLSEYGKSVSETEFPPSTGVPGALNFTYGSPALEALPIKLWQRLLVRHCRTNPAILDYAADPLGYLPLREAIAQYLAQARGVQCQAEQVMIVNGSQQGLDLTTRLLVNPGEQVAIEDPAYLGARRTFLAQGARLIPLPVDEAGAKVENLEAAPAGIRLVYVTPSHQYPTGAVLSLPRRLALLDWAKRHGAWILEDDYDSEFRYGGRPIPALQGLAGSNCTIYIGTFSKVLFPALRIGYLVVPKELVSVFARARWLADRQSPLLEQYALSDLIVEGHLERHIRRMRSLYASKQQILVDALRQTLGERVQIYGERAGLHLMVRLQSAFSDEVLMSRALEAGVVLGSVAANAIEADMGGAFLLGYANLSTLEILEGVGRLGRALSL